MSEISFADLRCRFQTGRSFIFSGEGRNRVYGYRNGVQCALGDLERSQWCEMARELIDRKGEQELYKHLLQYLKDHNYVIHIVTFLLRVKMEGINIFLTLFHIFL